MQPLICPILAMSFLIFTVLFIAFFTRVHHVRTKKVRLSYFQTFQQPGDVPVAIAKTSRNLVNQFEMPVLFFVICILIMHQGMSDGTFVNLAWAFVATRVVHAAIHITYNNVNHRLAAFFVGVVLLATMWIRFAIAVGAAA